MYSHLGGRLISPVTILQTYEQGMSVWGEQGMAALWGSATKKLIGAGVDSPRLTRDVANLVAVANIPVRSVSYGDGRASEQISLQRRLILEAADIRAIPLFEALLLAPGMRPALIRLRPWQPPGRRAHHRRPRPGRGCHHADGRARRPAPASGIRHHRGRTWPALTGDAVTGPVPAPGQR